MRVGTDMSEEELVSKTQIKNEMNERQALGMQLTKLAPDTLKKIGLSEELLEAVLFYKKITANGALKRQAQFIGRLMRDTPNRMMPIAAAKSATAKTMRRSFPPVVAGCSNQSTRPSRGRRRAAAGPVDPGGPRARRCCDEPSVRGAQTVRSGVVRPRPGFTWARRPGWRTAPLRRPCPRPASWSSPSRTYPGRPLPASGRNRQSGYFLPPCSGSTKSKRP